MDANAPTAKFLGAFEMADGSGRPMLPKTRKAQAAMVYCLHHAGEKIPRSRLMRLLWADRQEAQARASLRQALFEIRAALGPLADGMFEVDRVTVRAVPDSFRSDVSEDAFATVDFGSARLFDGLEGISDEFDEWILHARRVVTNRYLSHAEKDLARAPPGSDAALAAAERFLRIEPENESVTRAAMQILVDRGEQPRAQAVYDDHARALIRLDLEVTDEMRAFAAALQSGRAGVAPGLRRAPPPVEPPALAVGRIEVLGPDERFGRMIRESLAARAAEVPEFGRVVLEDGEPARGVDYRLSGSIALDGAMLHLMLGLSVAKGERIASIHNDADMATPITAMEELVDSVLARILPRIERHRHQSGVLDTDPATWGAYQHYLHGKTLIQTAADPDYMDRAEPHLEAAIEADQGFLAPYPWLISSLNSGRRATRPGLDTTDSRTRAVALARRFLVLDARNPNAHLALAWCLIRARDFDMAEASVRQAAKLRPYEANRVNSIGTAFVVLGDHAQGARFYALAQRMMVHDLDFMNSDLGELHYLRGDYETALRYLKLGEARNPPQAQALLAATLAQLGREDEARQVADQVLDAFRARWSGTAPFSRARAADWFVSEFPMRRPEDIARLVDGFRRAGFPLTDPG